MPSFPHPFRILQPATLAEACELLVSGSDDVALYAGGTELLLAMKQGGLRYDALVDLKTISGLDGVSEVEDALEIGALATHRSVATSPLVRARQPQLARLVSRIANARVRSTGTLGGNLCFAEPHSDPGTLLMALDATLRIEGPKGARDAAIEDFTVGPYDVALARGEILRSVRVPALAAGQRLGYHKVQLHERPMLGLAVRIDLDDEGRAVTAARAVVGAASPTPRRSAAAEALLRGALDGIVDRIPAAAAALADDAELVDDAEGSAAYKRHLIEVYLARIVVALARGQEEPWAAGQHRRPVAASVAEWLERSAHVPKPGFRVVGHSVPRTDGRVKVTGQAVFTGDVALPRMAFAKVLRSPLAHARIRSIDTEAARAVTGVLDVVVGSDLLVLPRSRYGHAIRDHAILAMDKVRFIGEPVAAVIAEDEPTAQQAADLISVDYEDLEPVMTAEEALAEGAPLVHEVRYEAGAAPGHVSSIDRSGSNLLTEDHVGWGDIEAAFGKATTIVEGEFYYPMAFAYPLEPYVAVADYGEDQLTVHSCGQHTYMVRRDLADIFGLPLSRVRVMTPYVGGGFGSKSYTKVEPLAAVCSWRVRRPVRVELTVDETLLTTRSDDARIWLKTGVDAEGRLIARQARVILNSGAYAENSKLVSAKTAVRLVGPYAFEAVDIGSRAAYTNTVPASSYRGFGGFHATLATEIQMDELAERLRLDPVEFRLRNLAEPGQVFFPGKRGLTAAAGSDLRAVADALGWDAPRPEGTGMGVALSAVDAGAAPVGRSEVRVHGDGSLTVLSGSAELGQGSKTVLAQIAAEEFGVTLEQVRVVQSDTALTPYARTTGADRTTTMEGTTVLLACREAKTQLREMAADVWEVPVDAVELDGDGARHVERRMTWSEIIGRYFRAADMEVLGRGHIRPVGDWALLPPFWELPLVGVAVDSDRETGEWSVRRLVTLGDVGLAINPAMAEGQDLGSAIMGLGVALREELTYEGQQLTNGSVLGYRVPGFGDLPPEVQSILVENQDGVGPYGAKGHGDGSLSSVCAAVSNALYQAFGVRLRRPPFTPERVWRAMRDGAGETAAAEGSPAGGIPDWWTATDSRVEARQAS